MAKRSKVEFPALPSSSYLSLLSFLLEFPLLLLLLLDSRFDLRERLPRERAKCRTVLLGLAGRKEGKSSRGIEGGEVQLFSIDHGYVVATILERVQ